MDTIKAPTVIGELMNHSYARARKAWEKRNIKGYQKLARIQTELGASYLTLNLDGTQTLSVTIDEMLDFLPELVPALQETTSCPISFDNPDVAFHKAALKYFDPAKSEGRPILNSLAVSRDNLDEMIELVEEYQTNVIVMASEYQNESGGHAPCTEPEHIHSVARYFVEMLHNKIDIDNDRIIIDPGMPPITSDLQGLVNMGLDAMKLIRQDPDLEGVHISVGLSNMAFGTPKEIRVPLERAYLVLALEAGLDWALANPEKNTVPLEPSDPMVAILHHVLEAGRVQNGESKEDAGFRQLQTLMEIWS